ncbi:VOC family protein [Rhizosphaericola mali]|uniref:Bleomycin resistance family protein n=1 Tax=Rhizosphaericola mali TaxID=2545455 RepID=A0A5P2G5R3_9BACT|nr:VOC family protein [Rhizosphaericola mali]QES89509.1 bleomycin resistance family protein [Rhizosphaericola mali]
MEKSLFKSLKPVFFTKEIQETVDFYSKILGFKVNAFDPEIGWAALAKDNIEIMLSIPNVHFPFTDSKFTGTIYFEITHIDDFWEKVNTVAKICYPIETFDYGMREFAIFDNNGYILQFGEEVVSPDFS